jgi:hypothetical protein
MVGWDGASITSRLVEAFGQKPNGRDHGLGGSAALPAAVLRKIVLRPPFGGFEQPGLADIAERQSPVRESEDAEVPHDFLALGLRRAESAIKQHAQRPAQHCSVAAQSGDIRFRQVVDAECFIAPQRGDDRARTGDECPCARVSSSLQGHQQFELDDPRESFEDDEMIGVDRIGSASPAVEVGIVWTPLAVGARAAVDRIPTPSHSFAINTAWITAAALAIDLLCWTRLLLDGPLAKAEPATPRYRLLHAAARLVHHARRLILRTPETWPWAEEFADAVNRVRAIP